MSTHVWKLIYIKFLFFLLLEIKLLLIKYQNIIIHILFLIDNLW